LNLSGQIEDCIIKNHVQKRNLKKKSKSKILWINQTYYLIPSLSAFE
jgi:hypothetical protein